MLGIDADTYGTSEVNMQQCSIVIKLNTQQSIVHQVVLQRFLSAYWAREIFDVPTVGGCSLWFTF